MLEIIASVLIYALFVASISALKKKVSSKPTGVAVAVMLLPAAACFSILSLFAKV